MTAVDELVAFVRAALDEDERMARECGDYGRWRVTSDGYLADDAGIQAIGPWNTSVGVAEHITRWDPTRVLAGVKADRRILAGAVEAIVEFERNDVAGGWSNIGKMQLARSVIEQLAQPYAGREGWREEWRA